MSSPLLIAEVGGADLLSDARVGGGGGVFRSAVSGEADAGGGYVLCGVGGDAEIAGGVLGADGAVVVCDEDSVPA